MGGQWHPASVKTLLQRIGVVPGVSLTVGDMRGLRVPAQSIDTVVTLPPYAEQRKKQYASIAEADYPEWTVRWMEAVRPGLKPRGSVAIVIRPHLRDGQISDYVLCTQLAVRDAGWIECEELIWVKPTAGPLGSIHRPRRQWESILWFSLSRHPWCDTKANGADSERIGLQSKKGIGDYVAQASAGLRAGTARCPDYVAVPTAAAQRAAYNTHPAQFPAPLAEWLIRLLSPPGGTVLDPFRGSGSTAVAAKNTGRRCVGWDIDEKYVEIARRRVGGAG